MAPEGSGAVLPLFQTFLHTDAVPLGTASQPPAAPLLSALQRRLAPPRSARHRSAAAHTRRGSEQKSAYGTRTQREQTEARRTAVG